MSDCLRNLVLWFVVLLFVPCCNEQSGNQTQQPLPDSTGCPPFQPGAVCENDCVGFPPINDLGTAVWRGSQGGLYPNGVNSPPPDHLAAGIQFANSIEPLDSSGQPDSVSGKIVLLAIGLSNTQLEFAAFKHSFFDTFQDKNPYLEATNAALGGMSINRVANPDSAYWDSVLVILAEHDQSPLQVQAIWFKEAELGPQFAVDTTFDGYTEGLKEKFKVVMNILFDLFPNAHLCYLASRIYSGHDVDLGNPEPFAYYTGWAVKRLIEDQLSGDPALVYSGSNAQSPWLSWGVYLWADGIRPRSDGLVWICPDDFQPDGRHPSTQGSEKVAGLLFDFFTSDATTTPWFLDH